MNPLAVIGVVAGVLFGVTLTGIAVVARRMAQNHERMRDG